MLCLVILRSISMLDFVMQSRNVLMLYLNLSLGLVLFNDKSLNGPTPKNKPVVNHILSASSPAYPGPVLCCTLENNRFSKGRVFLCT